MWFAPPVRLAACGFVAVLAGAAAAFAAPAGSLTLDTSFKEPFGERDCAAGVPETTHCYAVNGTVAIAGLGKATVQWTIAEDLATDGCAHAKIDRLTIAVAAKGELAVAAASSGCQAYPDPQSLAYTVTGGSGAYANATGSGKLDITRHTEPPFPREIYVRLAGTMSAPGATFDTVRPHITVPRAVHVVTRGAKAVRVMFTARASDAVDGKVAVTCKPRSGSLFRVGKTRVSCSATDTSANSATASFVVTVTSRR